MYIKKILNVLVVAAMFLSVALTGCRKDGFSVAGFRNGKFIPDIEEIVPSVAYGTRTKSEVKSLMSTSNSGEIIIILPSDIVKGDNVEWIYGWYDGIEVNQEIYKEMAIGSIDGLDIEGNSDWVVVGHERVKYEESQGGDKIIYYEGREVSIKVSMYADGVKEIYVSTPDEYRYSSYNGNRFIYLHKEDNFCQYMEFDEIDGLKRGVVAWSGQSDVAGYGTRVTYYAYGFEGNDLGMDMWHNGGEINSQFEFNDGSFSLIKNDYYIKHYGHGNAIEIDVRALNIKEISVDAKGFNPWGKAIELTLDNGSKIPGQYIDYTNVPWGELVYEFNVLPLDYEPGKYLHGFSFAHPFSEGVTTLNSLLAHRAPGLVSVQDFDLEYYSAAAKEAAENFDPIFDTFKHIPINIYAVGQLREAISEYIEEKGF